MLLFDKLNPAFPFKYSFTDEEFASKFQNENRVGSLAGNFCCAWLVASPVAWYFMHDWLQKYEYRIDVNPLIFFGAAAIAILISLLTISFQIIRAAVANPIKSLRSD